MRFLARLKKIFAENLWKFSQTVPIGRRTLGKSRAPYAASSCEKKVAIWRAGRKTDRSRELVLTNW